MSSGSLVGFLALVAFVLLALAAALWTSGRAVPRARRVRQLVGVGLGAALWLSATAALARSGRLGAFDAVPPPALLVLLAVLAATVALAASPLGRQLAHGVPLAALVGVQAFRVPLELLLHRLYVEGVLPVQVTYAGWNVDIVTGVLAVVLAVALHRGRASRRVVAAWNALGLGLVAVVVGTAVLSFPTPFQVVAAEPSTLAILTTVPLVWLPTVLVQAAVLGHLLVLRRLREAR